MFSLIICSNDPAKLAAVENMYRATFGDHSWELIGIPDAKSLAEGYNRGVARSTGDILIFSHDDVEILGPDFPARLTSHLSHFDLLGIAGARQLINAAWASIGPPEIFGQVVHLLRDGRFSVDIFGTPTPAVSKIQALDGVFMAARRSLLERIRFDAETFDHFHLYDIDFSYQAYHAGFKIGVANDINLLHHSQGNFDENWQRYAERFDQKWRGHYTPRYGPSARCCRVTVNSRAQALKIMTPSYWSD
ncbi:MAG TPA: glycosyltransferase [Tepidisphaeraceae bacterium]|jgi:GT2 family glycosyltransferase